MGFSWELISGRSAISNETILIIIQSRRLRTTKTSRTTKRLLLKGGADIHNQDPREGWEESWEIWGEYESVGKR